MNGADEKRSGLKARLIHEVKELLAIFLYLALFFCAFTTYPRLVMAEMGISYFHYGFALIKALVLAKVILLGQHVRFANIFDDRPLIVATFYKVILFGLFVLAFEVLEHVIGGFLHGEDLQSVFQEMMSAGRDELLARTLVMLVAFIPLFAFTETARVLGEGKIRELFVDKRPVKESAKCVAEANSVRQLSSRGK
jgi:hypothetical protein